MPFEDSDTYSVGGVTVKQYPHIDRNLRGKLLTAAREMRQAPTLAEDTLWQCLRGRGLGGYKFRRQYRIDRFIVDFFCSSTGLIVEVDGEVHAKQAEADLERENILKKLGYRVIRFTNEQVLHQTQHVLQTIQDVLKDTPSPEFADLANSGEGAGG